MTASLPHSWLAPPRIADVLDRGLDGRTNVHWLALPCAPTRAVTAPSHRGSRIPARSSLPRSRSTFACLKSPEASGSCTIGHAALVRSSHGSTAQNPSGQAICTPGNLVLEGLSRTGGEDAYADLVFVRLRPSGRSIPSRDVGAQRPEPGFADALDLVHGVAAVLVILDEMAGQDVVPRPGLARWWCDGVGGSR